MSLDPELQPIDIKSIEDAVYDWLVTRLELVPAFIWERQGVPQPVYPYAPGIITSGPTTVGARDETRRTTDLTQESGEEILLQTVGPVEFTLSLAFHVNPKEGATDAGRNALFLAAKAQASLGMRSVIEHLGAANVAIVKELGVTDSSVVVNGEWISRATLDVRLRTTSEMTERIGFIDKVQLVSDQLGVDTVIE